MKIEDSWVPVTTCKYPKKEGNYLVTIVNEDGVAETRLVYFSGSNEWISNAYWNSDAITAWMKLPKPYTAKGGSNVYFIRES